MWNYLSGVSTVACGDPCNAAPYLEIAAKSGGSMGQSAAQLLQHIEPAMAAFLQQKAAYEKSPGHAVDQTFIQGVQEHGMNWLPHR
jgi:hypothetical protein